MINGFFQLGIAERRLNHEIQIQYADRALDLGRPAESRQALLRLLLATTKESEPLAEWARGELALVTQVVLLRREQEEATLELTRVLSDRTQQANQVEALGVRLERIEKKLKEAESVAGSPRNARGALIPILTIVNDDGGTITAAEVELRLDGISVRSGSTQLVDEGDHALTFQLPQGYEGGGWLGDCSSVGEVVIAAGRTHVCRVTLDDLPLSR